MQAKGTRLEPRDGIYYIVWTGNSRGRSTRTRDSAVAEICLSAFIQERDKDWSEAGRLTVVGAQDYSVFQNVAQRMGAATRSG